MPRPEPRPAGVDAFRAGAPPGLLDALRTHGASLSGAWGEAARHYAHAEGRDGGLFVRYSEDRADRARLVHEVAVRGAIGFEGALRTPRVLAAGEGWLLEQRVEPEAWGGEAAVEVALDAGARLMEATLPAAPAATGSESLAARVLRMGRAAMGALRPTDLWAARRILAQTTLRTVTCHRDFHPANVLLSAGNAWVVDWERCGPGPAGLDLMQLWCGLEDEEDRRALFEGTVLLLGEASRTDLARLRLAVAVTTIRGALAARHEFDLDPDVSRRLLALLPDLRREAKVGG